MKYLLTIAIPTYNRAAFLKESLENIFSFVGMETEILVSDNGSIDNTKFVCELFKENPNFLYSKQISNLGYDQNVITCVEKASGDYIWFLSDDDSISDELYKKVLSVISKKQYAGVLINGRVLEREENLLLIHSLSPFHQNLEIVANDDSMPMIFKWSTLLSSQVLRKKDINLYISKKFLDTLFVQLGIFWIACKNKKIYLINDFHLTKYDSKTNNFGHTTAYIWLWNLLAAARILNSHGYRQEILKSCLSDIYKPGIMSKSGIVAHYILSRAKYKNLGGIHHIKELDRFITLNLLERITLVFFSLLPDVCISKSISIAKALFK